MTCVDQFITTSCALNGKVYLIISLIEMCSYLFLFILALFRIIKKAPAYIYIICIYSILRFVNWLFQFFNIYYKLSDQFKHQLFILPLVLILMIFSNLLNQWIEYLTQYKKYIKITLLTTIIVSIIVYIISTVFYYLLYSQKFVYNKFTIIGITGISYGILYLIVGSVNVFIWSKIRYLHLLDVEVYSDIKIIVTFLIISTLSFVLFSGLTLGEGMYQVITKQFVFICCNSGRSFTTFEWIEIFFFLSQIFPVYTMVIVSIFNYIKSQREPPQIVVRYELTNNIQ